MVRLQNGLQVQQGQQQQPPPPTFIQELAASISSFTELLNSLKAQQRQQYGSLLQQEQQLLEELGTLQLCVDSIEDSSSSSQAAVGGFLGSSASCSSSYNNRSDETTLQDSFSAGACRQDSPSKLRKQRSASISASKGNTAVTSMSRTRPSTASSAAAATRGPRGSSQQQPVTGAASSSSRVSLSSGPSAASSSSINSINSSTLLPEVVAYDNFVAQHGATGGWHPDDHNTFVALLRRSRYTAGKLDYASSHKCRQLQLRSTRRKLLCQEDNLRHVLLLTNCAPCTMLTSQSSQWRTCGCFAKSHAQSCVAALSATC
jgi:hypothetical protein